MTSEMKCLHNNYKQYVYSSENSTLRYKRSMQVTSNSNTEGKFTIEITRNNYNLY